jgi:hypothetical protein
MIDAYRACDAYFPASPTKAKTEIGVFAVQEEGLIKARNLLEGSASH